MSHIPSSLGRQPLTHSRSFSSLSTVKPKTDITVTSPPKTSSLKKSQSFTSLSETQRRQVDVDKMEQCLKTSIHKSSSPRLQQVHQSMDLELPLSLPDTPPRKAVLALGSGKIVTRGAFNLGQKPGHTLIKRSQLAELGTGDKLTLVGHGQDGNFGDYSPEGLAQELYDAGIRNLDKISLKGCKNVEFARQLMEHLDAKGVTVGAISARRGDVVISSSGRTLVDRGDGKLLHQVKDSKVEIRRLAPGVFKEVPMYSDRDEVTSLERSSKIVKTGHSGRLGDVKKLGGKGAGLQDLQDFCEILDDPQVRVPQFFVVDTEVYNKLVATKLGDPQLTFVRNQLFPEEPLAEHGPQRSDFPDELLDSFKGKSITEMGQFIATLEDPQRAHCARFLVGLINSNQMFTAIENSEEGLAIKEQYSQQFAGRTVAVRSSGTMEDGSKDSAAGLYKTILGNKGEEAVLRAVLETISSNFEPKVFVHRETYGQDISQSRMACVIQEVFEPHYAGVGFSLNPVNPHEITLNFAEGLGEFVVGSHGQPAKVTFNRLTKEISYEDGTAKYKFSLNEDKDRVDKIPFLEAHNIDAHVLDEIAGKLFGIIDKMEGHFKRPVDMEFGVNLETGDIALLQQRTITVTGTTTFSDLGDLNDEVHLESNSIFSDGVAKGNLKHIADPKTFDYSTLAPTDIIVVSRFTDEIEANIHKFAGFISLNGGDLDHGAIVLRQHHKVAMRVNQEQFAQLLEHDLGKEITLGVGKFSGITAGKIFIGDKQEALDAKATRETELQSWNSNLETLTQDLTAITLPENLDTIQDMGKTLKSMVDLNTRLLKCFHPEQGGSLGKFLDTDPFFFTTQDPDTQLENIGKVKAELGQFLGGLSQFVSAYVREVQKLNPDKLAHVEQETQLLAHLGDIRHGIEEAFAVLENPDEHNFRTRALAMQHIKDQLLKLDHSQGDIMTGAPTNLVSTHELIIRVHRNMFEELKNITKGYPDTETQGLVTHLGVHLPDFDPYIDSINSPMGDTRIGSWSQLQKRPEHEDDLGHISQNLQTLLGVQFENFEDAIQETYQPEHLSPLLGRAVQLAVDGMKSEPPTLSLIQDWIGKLELEPAPSDHTLQTQMQGLLEHAADKILEGLSAKGLNEYSLDESFITTLKHKLVDEGQPLSLAVLRDTLREKLYDGRDMPQDEALLEILNPENLEIPSSLNLVHRLAQGLDWNDGSQDDQMMETVGAFAHKVINEKIGPILLSELTQSPLQPQDHSVTTLVDEPEDWQNDMLKQLPSLSKGSVILSDGALVADIPLGSHSMEMMAVQDKEKGGDANYLSVRYVDNTRGTGLTRTHIFIEFFKKCFDVDEIAYEKESQGLRFKIPNIDYEDKESPRYIGRVTQVMKQVFDASADMDFLLDITGRLPEFSQEEESERVKAFVDVSSGKTQLGTKSRAFIDSLTDVMKTVSDDLLKRKQPHGIGVRRIIYQFFNGVELGE